MFMPAPHLQPDRVMRSDGVMTTVWKNPENITQRDIPGVYKSSWMPRIDDAGNADVPIEAVLELWNPLYDDVWSCGVITFEDLDNCPDPMLGELPASLCEDPSDRDYNIARIVYLAVHGWDEDDHFPITIDIGLGELSREVVTDGNHRLAAAWYRGDKTVRIQVSGDLDKAEAWFFDGVHPEEYEAGY